MTFDSINRNLCIKKYEQKYVHKCIGTYILIDNLDWQICMDFSVPRSYSIPTYLFTLCIQKIKDLNFQKKFLFQLGFSADFCSFISQNRVASSPNMPNEIKNFAAWDSFE